MPYYDACYLLFTWLRRWLPSFGRSWHILSSQQACVSSARRVVSPDSDCHMWLYYSLLSLRRLRWVPVPMHSPSVVSRNPHDIRAADGYGAIIDRLRQVLRLWLHSTLAVISLFALLLNLLHVFAIKLKSWEVRLFTHFADWRAPPATLVARKQRPAKKREILTHPTKRLYDDRMAHLLCSNYWVQPIYQELLHSSSRYNATRTGERNRPSSGLARISAHPRPSRNWNHLVLAPGLLTGLAVFAMRILCRCGFLPTGPRWYCASCNTRRMPTELPTHLGWIWKWLRMT